MPPLSREQFKFPFYLIVHPYNGYWELKYDRSRRSSLALSFVILFFLAVTNILQNEYSGFAVRIVNPDSINSIMEIVYVFVPVLFWCVANWSLTTLMDGEGKFAEIFASTCFAMIPLVLVNFPWIWLSNVISMQEAAFYRFSSHAAVLWSLYLLFVGNMTVHQFTPLKTVWTMLLTVVAMGFLAFLGLLFFSLVQQIVAFVATLYQEIDLRR
ncbi:DUF1282 domain-containing protein [Cohnella sp. CFH 77786]|uniref:Yip1 family protein n=1 Tax=Cohnella sp. CFH 77786 TaxID=2662265 RepID=UPI001C608F2E|nr:Yip1 family protein [Cohnella sp. CFH 77786]MBW5445249.1 DUF1282 domain-containing protein [Cohnella sp. CFH 77786]